MKDFSNSDLRSNLFIRGISCDFGKCFDYSRRCYIDSAVLRVRILKFRTANKKGPMLSYSPKSIILYNYPIPRYCSFWSSWYPVYWNSDQKCKTHFYYIFSCIINCYHIQSHIHNFVLHFRSDILLVSIFLRNHIGIIILNFQLKNVNRNFIISLPA